MNIEIIIRDFKLFRLGIGELDGYEKNIYDFLVDNLTELRVYTSDIKPDMLYFGKSKEDIVLFFNSESEAFYVDSDKIWSFFENDSSMGHFDIQSLMRWWLGVELDLKPKHIHVSSEQWQSRVGDRLDLKPKHV